MNISPVSIVFVLLWSVAGSSFAQSVDSLKSLELMHGGWPRAFWFRQAEEGAVAKRAELEALSREFGGLMGIMGKALEEEVVGRSSTADFFTRFKAAHPRRRCCCT